MANNAPTLNAIDLVKLYTDYTQDQWNDFLTDCYQKRDLKRLAKTRAGLQVGMRNLERQKLSSEKMAVMFLRWQRSIEITAKKIVRELYPMPGDRHGKNEFSNSKWLEAKRKRDQELDKFFKDTSY